MGENGTFTAILWIAFGYLLGSCPTGYVLVKLFMGEDIRNFGSGNIGATNVSRVLGKKWAIITAVIDMLKGGVAVLLAMLFGVTSPAVLALVGVAGVLGHDYPVWIGFKGGKGVATTYGVFACYDFFNPFAAIFGGLAWFAVRELSGYVSAASMISLAAAVAVMPLLNMDRAYVLSGAFLVALTVWRHRENVRRLVAGTESRVKPFLRRTGGA